MCYKDPAISEGTIVACGIIDFQPLSARGSLMHPQRTQHPLVIEVLGQTHIQWALYGVL